jgi:hypothetical protein
MGIMAMLAGLAAEIRVRVLGFPLVERITTSGLRATTLWTGVTLTGIHAVSACA